MMERHTTEYRTIGSCDMAAITGDSPWSSEEELQRRLLSPTPPAARSPSSRMIMGTLCEDAIVARALSMLDMEQEQVGVTYRWSSGGCSMRSTPDAVCGRRGVDPLTLIEAKLTSQAHRWVDGGLPTHVVLQGLWHALGAMRNGVDADRVMVAAYGGPMGSGDVALMEVPFDEPLLVDIEAVAVDWHRRHIQEGEPVPPSASSLRTMRTNRTQTVTGGIDAEVLIDTIASTKATIKAARSDLDKAETALARLFGSAETMLAVGTSEIMATYRTAERKKIDYKALALALKPATAEDIAAATTTTTTRRLSIK